MIKRLRQGRTAALTALLLVGLLQGTGRSAEPWRESFDETCAKTSEAMTLSVDELNALLQKCDLIQKAVETQEESVRKVFTKRLQQCRNLYAYVLEYKKSGQSAK
jgi:hypothetical protein